MESLYVAKCTLTDQGMLMTLSPDSRSVSPMTPSPSREIRGLGLFRAISRKLARRSREDNSEEVDAESRSSSTDSCCSTSAGRCSRKLLNADASADSRFKSSSLRHISSSSSEAESDVGGRHRHHHSTSTESIRKVFQSLTLNTHRSKSCSGPKEHLRKSKKPAKRILRSPVTYTYVRGLSGLPTQRVPRNQGRVYLNGVCSCSVPYTLRR